MQFRLIKTHGGHREKQTISQRQREVRIIFNIKKTFVKYSLNITQDVLDNLVKRFKVKVAYAA